MLELKNIKKDYLAGENTVHALKGINLQFRENEFVSILGQSGCGKTTMLNIIGGLDHYSEGDLIINGTSTKDYNDRDWDTYRNHSIGFVFQSYNLIPHQTVLQNVEIALALSGVSKKERKYRAKKALEDVGLGKQTHKRPSELSGGQMQRVAIARALVNNPDIILADEPTGALDSETSIQVMDILKEISKTKLVIMVTHNPELAIKYSTRIIKMLDGLILDDSNPLKENELFNKDEENKDTIANINLSINNNEKTYTSSIKIKNKEKAKRKSEVKKPSMSFFTSFSLSLKNLFTKKSRTILTSFAGSIGIIGIALIAAVSQGTTNYINTVQEETLSSYPLTLQSEHTDLGSLIQSFIDNSTSGNHENDAVYEKDALYNLVNAINNAKTSQNDLKSFKSFIEEELKDEDSKLYNALSGVQYSYNLDMLVYTKNVDGSIIKSDTQELVTEMLAKYISSVSSGSSTSTSGSSISSLFSSSSSIGLQLWQELLPGKNGNLVSPIIENQYELVNGQWPNSYDEVVIVLDKNNEIDDMTLYALGLKSKSEIDEIVDAAISGKPLDKKEDIWSKSYDEIRSMSFKVVLNSSCYTYNEITNTYLDLRDTESGLQYLYENAINLRVSGIVKPKEDSIASTISGSICYTKALTEKVIEKEKDSLIIDAQINNPEKDILTGLPFKNNSLNDKEKQEAFISFISSYNVDEKAETYINIKSIPTDEYINAALNQYLSSMSRDDIINLLISSMVNETGMSEEQIRAYFSQMDEETINTLINSALIEQIKNTYATNVKTQLNSMSKEQLALLLDNEINSYTTKECANYYDTIINFSNSDYETNLNKLGYVDIDNPFTISLFVSTFDDKSIIEDVIKDYNNKVSSEKEISYTDYVGLMMSSVTTIIDAITYVLIAFVAVSLIVSSIMIGVITLISVQERTKEIGILRAIGASKRNISSMFNAETMIIGFSSGALGIILTYILCIPINLILNIATGLGNLKAYLPPVLGIILIIISVLLTLIAGIIPSRSAAKKDPVVALRTE